MSRATASVLALFFLAVSSIQADDVLDEPAPVIAINVTIAELVAKEQGGELELPDVSKPADEVAKKIDDLHEKGELADYQRIRLTTVDGQSAMYQTGARTPVVRGVTATARGAFGGQARTISDENTGMIVTATPKVDSAGRIVVEIEFERSALSDGPVLAEGPDGQVIRSGVTNTTTAQSTVSMPCGGSVILSALKSKSDSGETLMLILVRADVLPF